ncbi:MAG: radical SAM/SPASM domain-containing protein [Hyphomicrobiales bacterium]
MKTDEYIPLFCVWELTLKCNMNCLHCGSRAGKQRENELSIEEAMDVAKQIVDLGFKYLSFIGGEVFFYKGWDKVSHFLTSNGVKVNIITNGYLMGDKQIKEIRHSGVCNVAISLDGMKENHNRIRNNPRSFDRIKSSFDRLNKENIPIGINTTLVDINVDDLEPLHDFLVDNNVLIWQLQLANPMGNMSEWKELLISKDNIKKVIEFIKEKREENKIRIYTGDNIGYYHKHERVIRGDPGNINYWPGCQAGLTAIGIDSIGNVKGCESLYDDFFIEGNLREESLADIWYKEGNFAYNRNFDPSQLSGKCKDCDKGAYCRAGCRGACFFTKGELFENAYCVYEC